MTDLTALPHRLDEEARTCRAVVETPKSSRSKYDFDPEAGAFELSALLPEGMSFPLDFGFVPSTLAEDGDPLDVLVLHDEPCAVGALVDVRLIGVIEADQRGEKGTTRNDRLVAVSCVSRLYGQVKTIDDLGDDYLDHLKSFWVQFNALKGSQNDFDIHRLGGPDDAVAAIRRTQV